VIEAGNLYLQILNYEFLKKKVDFPNKFEILKQIWKSTFFFQLLILYDVHIIKERFNTEYAIRNVR